jgi:phosphate transport system substrate-binding protein
MRKLVSAIALSGAILATLTACDPPMPDSLIVELAERTVVCPESSVDLVATESVLDVSSFWSDSMTNACGLTFNIVEEAASGIEITDHEGFKCEPFLTVPVAIDAAVITFMVGENYELTFDAQTLAGIFSGKITNWSDPAIAALNEFGVFEDQEIIISPTALGPARDAMEFWLETETGEDLDLSFIADSNELESDAIYALSDGELRITGFSSTLTTGYPLANIATIPGDLASVVVPDARLIQTAGTQVDLVKDVDAQTVDFVYNRDNEVKPLLGAVDALAPYAPIYGIKMGLCGEDTVDLRNTARYLLRLDAQGVIATGVSSPLPEHIRIASAALIDSGNPSLKLETEVTK